MFAAARWRLCSIFPVKTLLCLPCGTFAGTVISRFPSATSGKKGIKTNNLNTDRNMYETEEKSELIGAYCTLLEDYEGFCDGQIVGDYGTDVVVRLSNGAEIAASRDEVIVFD